MDVNQNCGEEGERVLGDEKCRRMTYTHVIYHYHQQT